MAYRTAAALGALFVTALAFGAYGCTSMEGGRVHSADEYRARVDATKEAGARTVLALSPAPDLGGHWPDELAQEESSGSCVDDGDVTRDQPTYSWDLDFADPAAYRAAVDHLRRTWQEEGLTVKNVPAPSRASPAPASPASPPPTRPASTSASAPTGTPASRRSERTAAACATTARTTTSAGRTPRPLLGLS